MTTTIQPHELTIPVIDELKPVIYIGDAMKLTLDKMESGLDSLHLDVTSESDRKFYKSINRKLGSFFASADRARKVLIKPLMDDLAITNAKGKTTQDRGKSMREKFIEPLTAYEDEVLRHQQQIAKAFELMHMGHKTVGEFKAATEADWDALIIEIDALELTEELFGDRLKEAQAAQGESLEINRARRTKFVDDEAALEAGRKARKVEEDAEAAKRHAARVKEQEAKEDPIAKTPGSGLIPHLAAPENPKRAAMNAIYQQLCQYGCGSSVAREFVKDVNAGKINHLQIVI